MRRTVVRITCVEEAEMGLRTDAMVDFDVGGVEVPIIGINNRKVVGHATPGGIRNELLNRRSHRIDPIRRYDISWKRIPHDLAVGSDPRSTRGAYGVLKNRPPDGIRAEDTSSQRSTEISVPVSVGGDG